MSTHDFLLLRLRDARESNPALSRTFPDGLTARLQSSSLTKAESHFGTQCCGRTLRHVLTTLGSAASGETSPAVGVL